MPFVAVKGSKPLNEEELISLLASLVQLENVGLLLGAGASCSAGGMTMVQLWRYFVETYNASAQWLLKELFIEADALDLDSLVAPNVETLVDSIEVAAIEWERLNFEDFEPLKLARADLFRAIVHAALLNSSWWKTLDGASKDESHLQDHKAILQKLTAARQPGQAAPWIFTTNYDLAIEWAAEAIDLQVVNGFLGVHSRRFSPQSFDLGFRNTQARGEARFGVYNIYLAKLHGSLTWREHDQEIFEIPAPLAWRALEKFIGPDGGAELGFMVMPRAAKYVQTIGFALGELMRRFSEFLGRPQTCLLINGYGFRDLHVNRLIRSALLNPTLQLVIYLPPFTSTSATDDLPEAVSQLIGLNNPRVTIVGGGTGAYLSQLARQLPDPAIDDSDMAKLKQALKVAAPSVAAKKP